MDLPNLVYDDAVSKVLFSSKSAPSEKVETKHSHHDTQPRNQLGEGMILDIMSSLIYEKISE